MEQMQLQEGVKQPELISTDDIYGGVGLHIQEHIDSQVFSSLLRASMSRWRRQGKKGVWIKLPIQHANLVEPAVQEGFRYHHAEPDYLMLVYWIPTDTPNTLPVNATHRVGIGAFVMNDNREVLVVKEKNGGFKDTGLWKLPTGVVEEGEDICAAAVREVKEETGAQASEIEAAQWMDIEEYVDQAYHKEHQLFKFTAEICKAKSEKDYAGFPGLATTTASGKQTYLYFNTRDFDKI